MKPEADTKFSYLKSISLAINPVLNRYMSHMGVDNSFHLYNLANYYIQSSISRLAEIESSSSLTDSDFRSLNSEFSFSNKLVVGFDILYFKDGKIGNLGCMFLSELHESFKLLIISVYSRPDLSFSVLNYKSKEYLLGLVSPFQLKASGYLKLPME